MQLFPRTKINGELKTCHKGAPVILAFRNTAAIEVDILNKALGTKLYWLSAADVQDFDSDQAKALRRKLLSEHKALAIRFQSSHYDDWRVFSYPAKMARLLDATIQPLHFDGSVHHETVYQKAGYPQQLRPLITIGFGQPHLVSAHDQNDIDDTQHQVLDWVNDNALDHRLKDQTLLTALIDAKELFGRHRVVLDDVNQQGVDYQTLFKGIFALGNAIARQTPKHSAVAVLLPTSIAATMTFFALQAYQRIPAMLNFTAGAHSLLSALSSTETSLLITSKAFVAKAELDELVEQLSGVVEIAYLEDIRQELTLKDKLKGAIGMLFPRWLAPSVHDEQRAAILFTSGSEGVPKGVVLSHRNFLANQYQIITSVHIQPKDTLFNALPIFHSFGLGLGIITPLLSGLRSFLYPSPLHYKTILEKVTEYRPSIFLSTDTFLKGYGRIAKDDEFASLRLLVSGAEKVRDDTRRFWRERFDVEPLEGYGVTECTPVIAANTLMALKPDSVGRAFARIETRLEPVDGIDRGGRLFVKGPNVMMGYIQNGLESIETPSDGWHDTGDIVEIDTRGYITILGRAKRFSKIGGEMISLTLVEDLALRTWPNIRHAALAFPDEKKGERILLVTEKSAAERKVILAEAKASGITELAVPKKIVYLEEIPTMSSGKIDYVRLNRIISAQLGIDE